MKKDHLYLIATLGSALILSLIIFGFDVFKWDSTLDINIYDTYFVLSKLPFFLFTIISVFFCIYFIRAIMGKFKNQLTNFFLISATLGIAIFLGKAITLLELYGNSMAMQVDYSGESPVDDLFLSLSKIALGVQFTLLLFLVFLGVKTGQNLKKGKSL